jgi:hypothetical protein
MSWSKPPAKAGSMFIALLVLSGATALPAAAQDTVRVRGTIAQVDGNLLLIKSRDGNELKLQLLPNPSVSVTVKATMADIKPGSYLGVAALAQSDGSQRAISVHIFAEAMRGLAEGHRPWDLQPQSTMTNANVESIVAGVSGNTVSLKYKDGEQKIVIPADLQIVSFLPGEMADIKPGAGVIVFAAAKQADGTLQTQRITVGRDIAPPM